MRKNYIYLITVFLMLTWLLSKFYFIPNEIGVIIEGFAIAITLFGILTLSVEFKKHRNIVEKINLSPSKIFIHNVKEDSKYGKLVKNYIKDSNDFVYNNHEKLEDR